MGYSLCPCGPGCVHPAEKRKSRNEKAKGIGQQSFEEVSRSCHMTILLGLYWLQLSPYNTVVREARKCGLYDRWPCAQLKIEGSLIREEGETVASPPLHGSPSLFSHPHHGSLTLFPIFLSPSKVLSNSSQAFQSLTTLQGSAPQSIPKSLRLPFSELWATSLS